MFGAIFCVKEVHGMNDLIKLELVTENEAKCLHRLQVEAFMPLYENIKMMIQVRQKKAWRE